MPPAFPGQARALTDASRELGLEGVVLKRLSSSYQPGQRSGDWLKIRNLAAADVLIGGWLPRAGARSPSRDRSWPARPGPNGLDYLGSVGSGLAEAERRDLTARLLALERPDSPFAAPCRPTSPAGRAGPAPSWRPRSSTPASPRPGGCATPSGAACAPREHIDGVRQRLPHQPAGSC